MCYSALVHAEFKKFQRLFPDAVMDIETYVRTFWSDKGRDPRRKAPRALLRELMEVGPPELREDLRAADAAEVAALEVELFAQRRRVADAERRLQVRETKKAREDVRIGNAKVEQAKARIALLRGTAATSEASRIYPGTYCPVLVIEDGRRVVKPMRYQCRPAGKPADFDRRFPGTYNARRDNLAGFWSGEFGSSHALMIADRFYEHVEGPDGASRVLEFAPRTGEPMLIACLWSHWRDPAGQAPDLLSFAAITDEPEPEVAAAGHDRTVINLKPEHVDAWLDPQGDRAAMQAILDDVRHPFYLHREAA